MSFTKLLDAARSEVRREAPATVDPSPQKRRQQQAVAAAAEKTAAKKTALHVEAASTTEAVDPDVLEIVEQTAEFFFDIFDANCMEEFQAISSLELSTCGMFATWSPGDEFSFEQAGAHATFQRLFEELTQGFLAKRSLTQEQLFHAAKTALEDPRYAVKPPSADAFSQTAAEQAGEIWEVCRAVEDIAVWAAQQRELADRELAPARLRSTEPGSSNENISSGESKREILVPAIHK